MPDNPNWPMPERSVFPQNILCADDDPDIRAVLKIALSSIGGFNVVICTDGDEIISQALKSLPDLIMLDTRMPRLDGASTRLQLQEKSATRDIPVAFVTADQDFIADWRAHFPDIIGVLAKPFDPLTLADEVRELYASAVDD